MKEVPLRLFQLKPSSYLKELPLTLTRYGRPFLIVSSYKKSIALFEESKKVEVKVETPVEKPADAPSVESELDALGIGPAQSAVLHCQECHLEKKVYRIGYDDSDGTHLWDKWLCLECLKTIHEKVNKYGGRLKGR